MQDAAGPAAFGDDGLRILGRAQQHDDGVEVGGALFVGRVAQCVEQLRDVGLRVAMECPNVAELRKSPERWVPVGWDREVTGDYQAALKIEVDNRPGVLAQVAAAIAQAESNIDRVEYVERDSNISAIRFSIEVHDRKHLADVIRRVRRLGVVHGVQRL